MSVLEFKFHTWGKRDLKKGEGSLPLEAGWYTWMLLRVKCVFVSSTRTLEALTRIPHVVSTLIYLIYRTRAKYVALASGGCLRTGYRMSWDRCVCLSVCGGVRMCEVRTVAVLSDERGRVLSPTQSYWKRCSEPRLFQPQLIECICTQLHNDRWVSPQLTFFMFSLKKKRQSWPLFPHFSFCLSFSLCLFHLNFLKSGQKKNQKKNTGGNICQQSWDAFIPLGRRGRRRGRIHLADVAQFVFHISSSPATSFSGAQSDYTRQRQSESSCMNCWILSKPWLPEATKPFCFRFWNQPDI